MKRILVDLLRRAVGTAGLPDRLGAMQAEIAALRDTPPPPPPPQPAAPRYETLPGTAYSRYAIPLEYPPSRDLQPRWGNTRPAIAPLAEWMGRQDADYHATLAAMRARGPQLAQIRHDFDPDLLPEPAWCGVPYAPFDAAALYTLVGESKPKLYLEIGSGITTAFAHRAIRDHGLATRIVSIDPEPRAAIDNICDEVVRAGLETCDLSVFDALEPGDILFLDGSHRVFMNSDVTVFMIDVLPRVKPGVLIHVHDIQLPWDYPDMFVPWYWSEAYILAAYFLGGLDRVKPVLPTAWICRSPQFEGWFATPLVDLGTANDGWRGGGAMWFTHTR
jgi:predicted O-methyltransferase YrrM